MAVPDITPVTVVPPASPILTVTFPTSPAPTAVLQPIPVASVHPASLVHPHVLTKAIAVGGAKKLTITVEEPA